ncbi:MAG: S41 family peptidase [Bacteroidota bacterium]
MKKHILLLSFIFIHSIYFCQNPANEKFNFDFESIYAKMPVGWKNFGGEGYGIYLDSVLKKNGKYSAVIESNVGTPDFKAWAFTLPENYSGKKIKLSGFIKTENVTEGYAGLWMRIDPNIGFDNMNKRGISGTTDWTKCEITLDMKPDQTKKIVIGGLLVGKGKMWLDDLSVSIDGKDIKLLPPLEMKSTLAEKDSAFKNGSKLVIESINAFQIQNLKTLALVWGFVKYYHPQVAMGNHNWDYELLRVLPAIINSKSKPSRDSVLVNWINKLGKFEKNESQKSRAEKGAIKINPDLDWISTSGLSSELSSLLISVKNANRSGENYYISLEDNVKNPNFKNEEPYASMKYPDAGFRLLSVYRYWNIIHYYFPYKNLIEGDWKDVLQEFIPKVVDAKNETEYTLTILELIGRIKDTHANIWGGNAVLNKYLGEKYAMAKADFIEDQLVVTGYYDDSLHNTVGLVRGDIILKINSKSVNQLIAEKLKYTPASNYPTQLRDLAKDLLRSNDSTIAIEYLTNGKTQQATLKTYPSSKIYGSKKNKVADTCFRMITKDIAYVNNGSLKNAYLKHMWKTIENTKGLIIDDRNYPTDFVIYALSNYLMPEKTNFVEFTNGSITEPGLFAFAKTYSVGKKNSNSYKGKIIILVNETSQSSAEFHAMAYRVHPNATVIGSTTAGADGNVSVFYLPGGIRTMISGIGVYYPNGKETQGVGIVPDIEIKPTIKGIKEGKDEVLEKAIELINTK